MAGRRALFGPLLAVFLLSAILEFAIPTTFASDLSAFPKSSNTTARRSEELVLVPDDLLYAAAAPRESAAPRRRKTRTRTSTKSKKKWTKRTKRTKSTSSRTKKSVKAFPDRNGWVSRAGSGRFGRQGLGTLGRGRVLRNSDGARTSLDLECGASWIPHA